MNKYEESCVAAFLRELSQLSEKYQIYIDGCGCCGSPFLNGDLFGTHGSDGLKWDESSGKYTI